MKKMSVIVIALVLISSTAFASPLTDFSSGKGAIDLTLRDTTNSGNVTVAPYIISGDGASKLNLDGALTFGLGNNLALQFRAFSPESKDTTLTGAMTGTDRSKFTTSEFNILYKLDKNVAIFTGYVTAKGEMSFSNYPGKNFTTKSKNLWQFGVVASTPIGEKTTLWASAAAGTNSLTNLEIGVGYEIAPNLELNVNYREIKASDFTGTSSDGSAVTTKDLKAKGPGFGITYKF
jgi:hypothetical protein